MQMGIRKQKRERRKKECVWNIFCMKNLRERVFFINQYNYFNKKILKILMESI